MDQVAWHYLILGGSLEQSCCRKLCEVSIRTFPAGGIVAVNDVMAQLTYFIVNMCIHIHVPVYLTKRHRKKAFSNQSDHAWD